MELLNLPYRPDDRDISAGQRVLGSGGWKYNTFFPKPDKADKIVLDDGDVDDTLRIMQELIHRYIGDTRRVADELRKATVEQTVHAIWNFLYYNIQYKLDKAGTEELRRPARSWSERYTGIDCDCFSIFASSILTNLGIPHYHRVTRYSQKTWQHVYIIVPKDSRSLGGGYWTIDAVLAKADYEKPFTAKKDYKMNLSGIKIAVLSGVEEPISQQSATDVLMGFDDASPLGSAAEDVNAAHYENELYQFLVATRQTIAIAPAAYMNATGGNPSDMVQMLDYAIRYWYTDKREEALAQLERNEKAMNTLSGFDAFNAVQLTRDNEEALYGDDDLFELSGTGNAKGKLKKPAKFFGGLKKAVKKANVGKALVRFNPATIAIRNGFLLALKLNIGKMSQKMKWAYATPQQLAAGNVSPQAVAASKKALAKVQKMFTKIGGKPDNMRKAILHARKGHLDGTAQLGAIPLAAGIATAMPFIKKVLDVLRESGLIKPGEKAALEPDGGDDAQQGNDAYSADTAPATYVQATNETGSDPYSMTPTNTVPYMPAEILPDEQAGSSNGDEGLGSVFSSIGGFFRGNPGMALALTAGGAYLIYNATRSNSPPPKRAAGLGSAPRAAPKRKAPQKRRHVPVHRLR